MLHSETLPARPSPPSAVAGRASRIDTGLVGTLAALLIVNSHLEAYYPAAPWMAGDGLVGNSLFFLLSGFGLQMSESQSPRGFVRYFWRRITRIYPALFICVLVGSVIIAAEWRQWQPADVFANFIWPTKFTYFYCIVPFYALFFPILKLRITRGYLWLMLGLVPLYLVFYLPDAWRTAPGERLAMGSHAGHVHTVAYFQVMLLGGWLGTRPKLPDRPGLALALTALTFVAYVGCKLVMVKGHFANLYGLLHLYAFLLSGLFYWSLTSPPVVRAVRRRKWFNWVVSFVAGLTLEFYLVHSYLCRAPFERLRLPLNVLSLFLFTFLLSRVVGALAKAIQRALGERRTAVASPPGEPRPQRP